MRKLTLIVAVGLGAAGCGSNATTPAPTSFTLSGTVTSTIGATPLSGATVMAGTASTTTSATGTYSLVVPSQSASVQVTIQGAGLITRGLYATPSTHTFDADVLQAAGFNLTLYRELVRNTFDSPNIVQPLRRWTKNPNVFVQSDGTDTATEAMVESVILDTVPLWTNGFTVGTLERGSASPPLGQLGWLNVQFQPIDPGGLTCGQSTIAQEGGIISLWTIPRCGCGGLAIARTVVRHELGHAMGFYHTDQPTDVMYPAFSVCDLPITQRELAAAAIAYRRPVGNTDPDNDPIEAVKLVPMIVR